MPFVVIKRKKGRGRLVKYDDLECIASPNWLPAIDCISYHERGSSTKEVVGDKARHCVYPKTKGARQTRIVDKLWVYEAATAIINGIWKGARRMWASDI